MTRSTTPTDYILLPAYTDSELETCKFVIVHVPSSYKMELTTRLALLQPLKADPYLSCKFWSCWPIILGCWPTCEAGDKNKSL